MLTAVLGCERAPMPDGSPGSNVTTGPLDGKKNDTPPVESEDEDEEPAGDGDALPYEPEPEPVEEEPVDPPEGDGDSDAGTTDPTDPQEDDLQPSPKNAAACPAKAPKPPFDISFCSVAESLRCLYGKSYSCYCVVGGWVCSGG